MLIAIALAGSIVTAQHSAKWHLRPYLADKVSTSWDTSVDATAQGESHTGAIKLEIRVARADATKLLQADYYWKDMVVDGGQSLPDQTWNVILDPAGAVSDVTEGDEPDSVKACLLPMTFIYPNRPVAVGDTWTDTVKAASDKDDRSYTINMKADSVEKVGETDALKVTEDLTQKGTDGEKATSIWWVGKDGKVLKSTVHVGGWIVPVAGDTPIDADISGSLARS